jgi:hypothetical protein
MSVSTAISCVRNLLFILFEFISVHAYWYITLFLYRMMQDKSMWSERVFSSCFTSVILVANPRISHEWGNAWMGSDCSIFSCLYCVMLTIVHSVVLFLLVTVISVFLRINYHFGIFTFSLAMFQFKLWSMYLSNTKRLKWPTEREQLYVQWST